MKLKGFSLHIFLNSFFVFGIGYICIAYSERLNFFGFSLSVAIIYFCFLFISGAIKAIKEYFVIKKGVKLFGHIDDFVYGIRILGIAGYYPIISYEEGGQKKIIKYRAYRAMKKENYPKVTIYKWRKIAIPLEFSEWDLKE